MTHEDIIAMAQEAGLGTLLPAKMAGSTLLPATWVGTHQGTLERFAALVAAKEREACAQVCDASVKEWLRLDGLHHELTVAQMLADEIRARGQKEGA